MFLKPVADVLNGKPCVGENRALLIRNNWREERGERDRQSGRKRERLRGRQGGREKLLTSGKMMLSLFFFYKLSPP